MSPPLQWLMAPPNSSLKPEFFRCSGAAAAAARRQSPAVAAAAVAAANFENSGWFGHFSHSLKKIGFLAVFGLFSDIFERFSLVFRAFSDVFS